MSDDTLNIPEQPAPPGGTEREVFVGNYKLIRPIGSGAMGAVYLAQHRKFANREYAIKLIRSDITSEAARKRFEREITAMGGLVHPNLVYASDAGVDDERMYLVMEYVRGQDLQQLIDSKGPLHISPATEIIRQVCAGVAHAHQHGVVHRDIKPANIILSDALEVKVLDLGIASLQTDAASRMTSGGSVMGTAAFIAPELWEDAMNASPSSDVYAIGCTAYTLYTGSPPFAGEEHQSLVQIMTAHRQAPPVPLHVLRKDFPEDLSTLILRSLNKDADRRYQDAAEFADKLAAYSEPLSKDVSLFCGAARPSSYRGPTTTRIDEVSTVGAGVWMVSILLLLLAGTSLWMSYLGEFVTPAWNLFYGRLGDPQLSRFSGLALDSIRVIVAIPLACFVLARYYSGEVKRTFDPRHWSLSAFFVRLLFLATFVLLTHLLYQRYWDVDHLPTQLAERAGQQNSSLPSDAEDQRRSMQWYLGYLIISQALLATLTIAFPFAWFAAGDLTKLRQRLVRLMSSQSETSFSGRLSENLHRFGNDLRVQAGRLLAVVFVAALVLQYDYWLHYLVVKAFRKDVMLPDALLVSSLLGGLLTCALAIVALVYLRGYEATSRLIASVGSVRDEEDLSKIGVRWLMRSTLLNRLSGIGCLSIAMIIGHSIWRSNQQNTIVSQSLQASADKDDPEPPPKDVEKIITTSWMPQHCEPAPGAKLVTVEVLGNPRSLWSEVLLRPAKPVTDPVVSNDDASIGGTLLFLLVPQTRVKEPPSFYIMKEKVTAVSFERFENAFPGHVNPQANELRRQSLLASEGPAYHVTGVEAKNFAAMVCGGQLPTAEQWDAAFGRFFDEAAVSKSLSPLESFLSRAGSSGMFGRDPSVDYDVTPWGCLEMNSRGFEFTRFEEHKLTLEVPEPELRGWSETEDFPLTLAKWESSVYPDAVFFGTLPVDQSQPDVGFRVVLDQEDE